MLLRYVIIVFFTLPFYAFGSSSENEWVTKFDLSYYHGYKKVKALKGTWQMLSESTNVTDLQALSYGLDALIAMFQATGELRYLDDAISLTNNVINKSRITNNISDNKSPLKDSFRGWIESKKTSYPQLSNKEVVLSEIYYFRYVAKLLRIIKQDSTLFNNSKYRFFYVETLNFIEVNIWDKWVSRGVRIAKDSNKYLFLLRAHMACHWAYIAAELYIVSDSHRKESYLKFVNLYNTEFVNILKTERQKVSWNATWSFLRKSPDIQDVSHANLIVSYLVEADELGLWRDKEIIQNLINTLKYRLWDSKRFLFKDYLDGSTSKDGLNTGSFQGDGFVKLTMYDEGLFSLYRNFVRYNSHITRWNQHGQLFAHLALAQKRKDERQSI